MKCPRCKGPFVLRTGDHDELRHYRLPFACARCGHAFDSEEGIAFPEEVARPMTRPAFVHAA